MILSGQSITKTFGENVILRDASFQIEAGQKAALVGSNGAGKTTLLKIITQQMPVDSGQIILAKDATIGYLTQHQELTFGSSIYTEVLSVMQHILDMEEQMRRMEAEMKYITGEELERLMNSYQRLTARFENENGYACKSEVTGVLKGLGFEESEFSKDASTLSGGQKTRISLGKLLLTKPDILLLDEPTNHLDMDSIAWLETYLLNYPGAVLLVSHDRFFLDRVVSKVIEIEHGSMLSFQGNYSAFAHKKSELREAQYKAYMNQQREIRHQQEVIDKLKSYNREKSIKRAESREKLLSKMEVLERPPEEDSSMRIHLTPRHTSGQDVLYVEHLSKSFPNITLFEDISFEIKRNERIALIGNNGTGKTTILKILNGLLPADGGTFRLGANVHIGYYDQEHHVLHMNKTIFEEISDDYPTLSNTQIRNVLAAFLFTNDDVYKPISTLSGGERGRVSLAKLMLYEANFLILDEPTNHLDIASKEILEDALTHYSGTVLYVSHDRYFINQTATRILDLTNTALVNYIGNYEYYLEKKEELTQIYAPAAELTASETVSEVKLNWQEEKKVQAGIRKRENDLKLTEKKIEQLEARDEEINTMLALPDICTDVQKCIELSTEQHQIKEDLELLYEQWSELA
ncbi:MAG: ABC-F family ATP-binding cassette domain-containing protein [Lachnospiraceae bacterium]